MLSKRNTEVLFGNNIKSVSNADNAKSTDVDKVKYLTDIDKKILHLLGKRKLHLMGERLSI